MAKVTFDGVAKIIDIIPGISTINVEADLYSIWKEWTLEGDNSKYQQAFRTIGGDPLVGGKVAPKYFFLMNGWVLRTYTGGGVVYVETNLFSEGGGNPFVSGGTRASIIANTNDGSISVVSGEGGGAAPTPQQNAQAVWDYLSSNGLVMRGEVEEIKKKVKENQGLILAGL
jgi:hypothetical protein